MDPLLSLSMTLHSNKGCYAILLGSGVSRSAGIPTGWEIILDLSRQLAKLEKDDCEPDPAAWFKRKFGKDPDYGDFLQKLALAPTERSQLLRPYFEPTTEDLETKNKRPTAAHKSIARLVQQKVIKVIVTTNFDRLMEKALEELDIVPQVISTTDAVEGALPLAHAPCTVIKVHGDYLDTRIKNAPHELETYDDRVNSYLDQVFDEYGLIICGWSGDWDVALRAAIERCKSRRFWTYWIARGQPSNRANSLIQLRSASVIHTSGADEFFVTLTENVTSLSEIATSHPVSAKVAVATLKRYIVDERSRIRLADLVRNETEAAHEKLIAQSFLERELGNFPTGNQGKFRMYEEMLVIPLALMIHGCHWGETGYIQLWVRMLARFATHESLQPQSFTAAPDLRMYSAMLLLYGGGIAAILAERYDTVLALLEQAQAPDRWSAHLRVSYACMVAKSVFEAAGRLEGRPPRHVPLSDYLYETLRESLRDLEPDDRKYEIAFDRFECFMALTIGHINGPPAPSKESFAQPQASQFSSVRMPIGRFGWRRYGNDGMVKILQQEQELFGQEWPPLQSGMCGGDAARFKALLGALKEKVDRLMWE